MAYGVSWAEQPTTPSAVSAAGIQQPLSTVVADPDLGRAVFLDRERGHCLLCHTVSRVDEPFQGNLGPPLDNVATRLDTAALRLRLVDSTRLNPDSVMPPYHRIRGLQRVGQQWRGQPILNAAEVEHLLAWLLTLREPA